ncbi:MAG TPA: protein-L-isoaspartate(D-aspartate) O-methyltransferase [Thermoanaerobaculia bacterium]|nr:protein-L-isoaspartate(D-aspartate) O-methyltransferase [Thermoanaerobaculia bacterium]
MKDYTLRREAMVRDQIAARGIRDPRLLEAMRQIPRHEFVPEHLAIQSYGDHALPIGGGQTISQPYVVARMTELLALEPGHKVLEIGTGSGYQTAILALLARWVFSLERVPELAKTAIERMRKLGLQNVKIQVFDGTVGWSDMAPFDRILVTAGAPRAPQPLLDQLSVGGRMVIPEGDRGSQRLVTYDKTEEGLVRQEGEPVAFVPLLGRHGWEER